MFENELPNIDMIFWQEESEGMSFQIFAICKSSYEKKVMCFGVCFFH